MLIRSLFLAALLASAAVAQSIGEIRWGFDGRVVLGEFNLLSVVVENQTDEPFEGTLVLEKGSGVGGRLGARLIEPCFLAPRSQRIVQFYPFLVSWPESWSLRWDRSRISRTAVPVVRVGRGAVVLLDTEEVVRTPVRDLRTFPTHWFPTTFGATACLSDVLLDRVPEWDGPRRTAFLHWLRAGGRVHMLWSGGEYPRFTGELAVLNQSSDRFRVGAGQVIRYTMSRATLTAGRLELATGLPRKEDADFEINASTAPQILNTLREQVQPEHQWGLIFLAGLVFLVLIGPVHWKVARAGLDYRLSILALLLGVAAFTWLFLTIGARGYGERAGITTLAYARPVESGRYAVFQYSNAFATSGDMYRFTDGSPRGVFSTAQQHEAVAGVIENGRDASLTVDIPLFSSRAFVHEAVLPGPAFEIAVSSRGEDRRLEKFVFSIRGEVPTESLMAAWAVLGDRAVKLRLRGDTLVAEGQQTMLVNFLGLEQLRNQIHASFSPFETDPRPLRDRVEEIVRPMIAERLRIVRMDTEAAFGEKKQLSVMLVAASPPTFHLRTPDLGQEESYVVYHLDVPDDQ